MQRGTVIPADGDNERIRLREYDGHVFLIQTTGTGEESVALTAKQAEEIRYWLNEWHDEDLRLARRYGRG